MNEAQRDNPRKPLEDHIFDEELPGDPVCLLRRVCQRCGSVADEDPPTVCPTCHADLPAD